MRFGEFVVSKGIISEEQLQKVLLVAKYRHRRIGRLMKDLGHLTEYSLDSLLVQFLKPNCSRPFSELKAMRDQVELSEREKIDKTDQCLAIKVSDSEMTVAVNEFSDSLHESLEAKSQKHVHMLRVKPTLFKLLQGEEKSRESKHAIVLSGELTCDQKVREDNPFTKMTRQCIEEACKAKASDIHFEPFDDRYLIRFRVHGTLQDWKTLPVEHSEPITNKLKWILNLDLAIASKPQDSRASFDSLAVDMRVNSMPTASGGEKIVVRIQYQEEKLGLSDIGLKFQSIDREMELQNEYIYSSEPGKHVCIKQRGPKIFAYPVEKNDGSGHTPSVNQLFESASKLTDKCLAVMLTGMGSDGAAAMKLMRSKGHKTVAQDESAIVYGMPKAAVECGAVCFNGSDWDIQRLFSNISTMYHKKKVS